jgi:hypothetical protein
MQTENNNKGLSEEILDRKKNDFFNIDPRTIVVEEGFNVRKDYGDIEGLARSIVADGVIEALEGFKKRGEEVYVMTEGHRRLKAIHLAIKYNAEGKAGFEDISKIARVPFMVTESSMKERLKRMGITGTMKKNLTELERAELYKRLIELAKAEGKSMAEAIKEIKNDFGMSQATIYNILKLDELDADIKQSIEKAEISANVVISIMREVKDKEEQRKVITDAIADAKKEEGKKATAKNVKGLKAKTPMAKIREAIERLEKDGVNNSRVRFLKQLEEVLSNRKSHVKKIIDLCNPE